MSKKQPLTTGLHNNKILPCMYLVSVAVFFKCRGGAQGLSSSLIIKRNL